MIECAECEQCGWPAYGRGPLCKGCHDWAVYWRSLTKEERDAELRMMDDYVSESEGV